ncbi:MAG: family 1 glycosylhydrolase [Erythrobacter sp.]
MSDAAIHDTARIDYINQHLDAVLKAVADGLPVEGYFLWSLLDNYEWALGYKRRFGMVHVDFDSIKRTPQASFLALKDALQS